jgi:uridine kinase
MIQCLKLISVFCSGAYVIKISLCLFRFSDGCEVESSDQVFLQDEAEQEEEEKDNDYYPSPNSPPPPLSPRPPSTGSQKSPRSKRQRTASMSQSSKKTSTESILRSHTRTIYTAGRPPWYNSAGQQVEPFVIGIQ